MFTFEVEYFTEARICQDRKTPGLIPKDHHTETTTEPNNKHVMIPIIFVDVALI